MLRRPINVLRPISTIYFVRRHIFRLPDNVPFLTRDFLSYGHRAAVDQCLSRMVKSGLIKRLARGVFIKPKPGAGLPSAYEVAKVKAEAFGRTIYLSGAQAAVKLGFSEPARPSNELTFLIAGHSSSFQYGDLRIRLKSMSSKYLKLEDDFPALATRAFLHFGKHTDTNQILDHPRLFLWKDDKYALRLAARWMPTWLSERIYKEPAYDHVQLNLRRAVVSLPGKKHSTLVQLNQDFRNQ